MKNIRFMTNVFYLMIIIFSGFCSGFVIGKYLTNNKFCKLYFMYLFNINIEKNAAFELAKYYQQISDENNMKKYYLISMHEGNHNASYELAKYHESKNNYNEMERYYFISTINNNKNAAIAYSEYLYKQKRYLEALTYYNYCDTNNIANKIKIGYCYYYLNDINEISEPYIREIINNESETNNVADVADVARKLLSYYRMIDDDLGIIKCSLLIFNQDNDKTAIINLLQRNETRKHYIKYLQSHNVITVYDKICPICLDSDSEIINIVILSCGHSYCFSCLLYLSKCTHQCAICKSIIA